MGSKFVKIQYIGKKGVLDLQHPSLSQFYLFEKDNDFTVKMDYNDAAILLRESAKAFKVVSGKVYEKDINPPPPAEENKQPKYYPMAKLIKMTQKEVEAYAKEIGIEVERGYPKAAIIKLIVEKGSKKPELDAAGDPAVDYVEPDGSPAKGPAV